jgi:hypothetical protein
MDLLPLLEQMLDTARSVAMPWITTAPWQLRHRNVILEHELRAKRPPNSRRAFFVNDHGQSASATMARVARDHGGRARRVGESL